MHRVWTLARKDLKLLVRDRAALFWVFVWPLLFGIFFGSLMGGSGERTHGLGVAVIDEDSTRESKEFVDALRKSEALSVRDTLSLEGARDRVRRGVLAAYVRVLPGFAKASGFRPGESTAIELGIDPARKAERGILEGLVTQASFTGIQKMFAKPDRMRASLRTSRAQVDSSGMSAKDRHNIQSFLGSLEVYLDNLDTNATAGGGSGPAELSGPKIATVAVTPDLRQPRTAFEISFPSAILWALLGCTMGFAQSLVTERTMGTYGRLRSTPLTRAEFLLGKGLASYLTGFTVIVALLAIGRGLLGVRLENPGALVAAVLTIPLCFTGLMLLFANLGKSERAVSGAGWAVMLVFSMLGGGMIPLIAMPPWMQTASGVSPVKWGIVALEGSVWRGYSPAEMALPCAILAGVGLVGFSIGWVLSKRLES